MAAAKRRNFGQLSEVMMYDLLDSSSSDSVDELDVLLLEWAKSVKEMRTLENISEQELDKLLAHFVLNARKQNGDEYEPDTLTSMLRSSDRLLREKGKHYSILTDIQFAKAREALSCKQKQLRRAGKGQKPNKALELSETQIHKLWDEKQLGCHTP
ncbi:uncharacterized protein LOC141896405 [Acropora palmata]|uniref:uncharacterized protein LOC141896405 n=1 Tax=Acropora palmata TaxID=6131 RepID=UPI003D9FD095